MRRVVFLLALVALVALSLGSSPAGRADTNPLAGSSVACADDTPANGLLPGDTMSCTLTIQVAAAGVDGSGAPLTNAVAEVDLQPSTFMTNGCPACSSKTPSQLQWNAAAVGTVAAGASETLAFDVKVGVSQTPGTVVSMTGFVEGLPSGLPFVQVFAVYNLVTFFQGSTLTCSDPAPQTPGKILPGDDISCDLNLVNPLPFATTGISAVVPVPAGTVYKSGGASATSSAVLFGSGQFPDLPGWNGTGSPPSESANMVFTVLSSTVAGTKIATTASLSGTNNSLAFTVPVGSNQLVTDPGPANLTKSTLACRDTNGGTLVAGDDLTCTVTAAPLLGFENVTGTQAVVAIPNNTSYVSGGSGHDASTVTFGPALLGDIVAGNTKSATFHVAVAPGTPIGTVINDSGSLTAISVPSGKAVGPQPIVAAPLTIGFVDPNSADLVVSGNVDKPAGTLTLTGDSAKDRAHIAVTLRNNGPSTSVNPTVTIAIPPGVTFESLDSPGDCSRVAATTVSCTPGAGTLAPGATYAAGATVSVAKLTPETYQRVIALGATADTPDPVIPNQATAVIRITKPRTSRTCASRRTILVHILPPRGQRWRKVVVKVAGKSIKVKRGKKAWTAKVVLKGGKPGLAKVSITGTTTKGKVVKSSRKYQKCKKKVVKKKKAKK